MLTLKLFCYIVQVKRPDDRHCFSVNNKDQDQFALTYYERAFQRQTCCFSEIFTIHRRT